MAGKPFSGSIDLTLLIEAAKIGHSAFVKAGKDNHIYVNVTLWENETVDKYGNTMSLQVNPAKNAADNTKEGRFYLGNFKPVDIKPPVPLEPGSELLPTDEDFANVAVKEEKPETAPGVENDPLPF